MHLLRMATFFTNKTKIFRSIKALQAIKALHMNYARGRRSLLVLASCIYIAAVRGREPYLLIDLAEATEINVFELGSSASNLAKKLQLHLSINDPTIYLRRYADQLNIGQATHQVAQDSIHILQLMQRDWLTTGRRPNGLCAACLLLASRAHGFHFSLDRIAQIVNMSPSTIKLRLSELSNSTSSQLSLPQLYDNSLATPSTAAASPTEL